MAVEGIFPRKVSLVKGPLKTTALDWGHPLSRGLIGAWPLINGDLRNAAFRRARNGGNVVGAELLTEVGDGISTTAFRSNLVPEFAGSADYVHSGVIDISSWTALSSSFWAKFDSSGTDEHTIISNFQPGLAGFRMALEPADDTLEFVLTEQANNNMSVVGNGGITVDQVHHFVVVYDPLIEGNMRVYIDGIRGSTTTAVSGVLDSSTTTDQTRIGESVHTADDSLTGGASNGYLWRNRALTDAEVMSLYKRPWQLYTPRTQFIPVGTIDAVVGGPNLLPLLGVG